MLRHIMNFLANGGDSSKEPLGDNANSKGSNRNHGKRRQQFGDGGGRRRKLSEATN